jgi:O-antigen/teichoic acid export membrane protein
MVKSNSNNFVNSKQKSSTKNIKFIWYKTKYYKENLYHVLFLSSIVLGIILIIIGFVVCILVNPLWIENSSLTWGDPLTILCCLGFISILIGFSFYFSERKIRKIRLYDSNKATNSTIK